MLIIKDYHIRAVSNNERKNATEHIGIQVEYTDIDLPQPTDLKRTEKFREQISYQNPKFRNFKFHNHKFRNSKFQNQYITPSIVSMTLADLAYSVFVYQFNVLGFLT